MEETLVLILLVIVMLVGSYLAGNIPLVVNWSEEKLKVVTVFGAGLLVGTALTVIIPEGIRALYEDGISHAAPVQQQHLAKFAAAISAPSASLPQQNADPLVSSNLETEDVHNDHSATIGLSLVLGFIFMMLVEQISLRRSGGGPTERNITATLGLVVHAAADGVALGAAATTSHQDVEMIVFLAIMLHKAPAAFGLVSFLLHEGVERQRIRKHLAIFSLSAPLLTLLTYFCIGQEQKETLNSVNATGIAMLFSAGTFLYVATVHVLPELTQNSGAAGHHNKRSPSSSTSSSSAANVHYSHLEEQPLTKGYSGLRNTELFIMICGALLPLVITIGHHH